MEEQNQALLTLLMGLTELSTARWELELDLIDLLKKSGCSDARAASLLETAENEGLRIAQQNRASRV